MFSDLDSDMIIDLAKLIGIVSMHHRAEQAWVCHAGIQHHPADSIAMS